jgi:hypothetical protein
LKQSGFERYLAKIVSKPLVLASRLLLLVDIVRKKQPIFYHLAVVLLVSIPTAQLWQTYGPSVADEHANELLYQGYHYIAVSLIAFVVSVLLIAILPWFLYLPYAAEMRALGLLRISTDNGGTLKLIESYIRHHEKTEKIKIICISGKNLFREPRGEDAAPFLELARKGMLDVVMPVANATNPTIASRYETYEPAFRDAVYPAINTLVEEVATSREFLVRNKNTITEHDILCFWRVVILSNVCLVQNYFPNAKGKDSDWAPTFVFERIEDPGGHSYYKTFDKMFELAKKHKGKP